MLISFLESSPPLTFHYDDGIMYKEECSCKFQRCSSVANLSAPSTSYQHEGLMYGLALVDVNHASSIFRDWILSYTI